MTVDDTGDVEAGNVVNDVITGGTKVRCLTGALNVYDETGNT